MLFTIRPSYAQTLGVFGLAVLSLLLMGCPDSGERLTKVAAYDLDIAEPSGLSIGSSGKYLYVVSDRKGRIFQTDLQGKVIGNIDIKARDYEGIAYDDEKKRFYLLDEKNNRCLVIDQEGKTLDKMNFDTKTDANSGPEGITLAPDRSSLYIVNEKRPTRIFQVDLKGDLLREIPAPKVSDLSGIAYAADSKELFLISDEDAVILKLSLQGKVRSVHPIDIQKAEGIALDEDKRLIYIVSDEEEELHIYRY